jgi:ADP-heptose:LPS heptosyltransferase
VSREGPSSLVYHAGALGDFLTCLPAFHAWRTLHPEEKIVLLGKAAHAELAPEGTFDEVWDAGAARFSPLFAEEEREPLVEAAALGSALLFCRASSPLPGNLQRLGGAGVLRQDPFPPPGERVHVVDYHLSLFPELRLTAEERLPRVRIGAAAIREADASLPAGVRPALLHPGSGSPRKNWPAERFLELAARLAAAGERPAWVLGPAEAGFAPPERDAALRGMSLPALAAAAARARLFVGGDSGVAHLAAAAGAPCVVLFGASEPAVWAPRGVRVRCVGEAEGGTQKIKVREVLGECAALLRE